MLLMLCFLIIDLLFVKSSDLENWYWVVGTNTNFEGNLTGTEEFANH